MRKFGTTHEAMVLTSARGSGKGWKRVSQTAAKRSVLPRLTTADAGTETADGTLGATVVTNEASGSLYFAVVTNGGVATNTQVVAGAGGDIVAGKAGNAAVTVIGTQTTVAITGLSASTTYQIKFVQRDVYGNDSEQASAELITTI